MKPLTVHLDCYPCFLKQTAIALRFGTEDEGLRRRVMTKALDYIKESDLTRTPAHAASHLHRGIRQELGFDPFAGIKSEYNQKALGLYPELLALVQESPDPLWSATRLAIAGNVIDFGIFSSVDMEGTVKRALEGPIAVDGFAAFTEQLQAADNVLYLLDNAGEAVFDRLLIETITAMGKQVTAVAKGGPVINDCTKADAKEVGISDVCQLIDNGSDCIGTILESTSADFRSRFEAAPLVISKGQGNFETLMDVRGNIFHLFQSKCESISQVLGLDYGAMILWHADSGKPLYGPSPD